MAEDATVLMFVPEIEGSATLVGTDPGLDGSHEGWIPVESCTFTFSRDLGAVDSVSDDDAEGIEPTSQVQPITVKRRADGSTAQLLMWLATKPEERKKDQVLIDYCAPSGRYYLRYELKGVMIVSSSIAYTAPDDANETITLTYDRIAIMQRPMDITGEVMVSREGMAEYIVFEQE